MGTDTPIAVMGSVDDEFIAMTVACEMIDKSIKSLEAKVEEIENRNGLSRAIRACRKRWKAAYERFFSL